MKELGPIASKELCRDHGSHADREIAYVRKHSPASAHFSSTIRGTSCPACREPIALRRTGSVRVEGGNWEIQVRCRSCSHVDWQPGM